jgi:hypothetical protein
LYTCAALACRHDVKACHHNPCSNLGVKAGKSRHIMLVTVTPNRGKDFHNQPDQALDRPSNSRCPQLAHTVVTHGTPSLPAATHCMRKCAPFNHDSSISCTEAVGCTTLVPKINDHNCSTATGSMMHNTLIMRLPHALSEQLQHMSAPNHV